MTRSTNRSITRSPLLWVAGLVVVAFAIALLLSGGDDAETTSSTGTETAPVDVAGEPLPTLGEGADPALGATAPAIAGVSFDGDAVEADPGARVYGFFAHWCPHCQRELPIVEEWLDEGLLPDGVDFLAVSTAVESGADNFPPSAWFADVGYDAAVLVDDDQGTVANAFGLSAFPFWVVTDDDGAVVARITGGVDRTQFQALGALALAG